MQPAIGRDGDLRVSVAVYVPEVRGVVRACRGGRVPAGADACGIGHCPHDPVQPVVGGNGHSWPADAVHVHALLVGNVRRAIRRDANVSMQATAGAWTNRTLDAVDRGKEVDGNACPEGECAVSTPRAEGSRDILRAVVDGVSIRSLRYWHRRSVMAASDSLMINASGLARALGRGPRVAVIISVGKLAGDSVKLRGEGSVWAAEMTVVSEKDGIEAQPRKGRALVLPRCGDGFDRVSKGRSQLC